MAEAKETGSRSSGCITRKLDSFSFSYIRVSGDRLAVHEKFDRKSLQKVQVIEFDKDFFHGKKILVFDDILTKGFSYARFACQLEKIGGEVLGGFFLGKTVIRM